MDNIYIPRSSRSSFTNTSAGAVGGGGVAFARYNFTNSEQVRVKRTEIAYDVSINAAGRNPLNLLMLN